MLSQEAFFYRLNQSMESTVKKIRWEKYIKKVTAHILSVVSEVDRVLIIGAGSCDDFNLAEIVKRAKKVIISDIDVNSMKRGLIKHGLNRDQVELFQYDYTGLSQYDFFGKLETMLKEGKSIQGICHYIEKVFKMLQEKDLEVVNQMFAKADVVVVLPIYSQLVLPLFQVIMEQIREASFYTNRDLMAIENTFLEYSTHVIQLMNRHLLAYASKGSKILVFADILEYQEGNSIYNQLEKLTKEALIELEETYVKAYGFGYGHYGIEHLRGTMDLTVLDYLIWPYSEKRKLIVKVLIK